MISSSYATADARQATRSQYVQAGWTRLDRTYVLVCRDPRPDVEDQLAGHRRASVDGGHAALAALALV
jgi:hypothetical protein